MLEAIPAAPWSRSHSNERIVKLEFEGLVIVVTNEIVVGTAHSTNAITAIRLARPHGVSRGGSGRGERRGEARAAEWFVGMRRAAPIWRLVSRSTPACVFLPARAEHKR